MIESLREIWGNRTLTNGGPFHQRFEQALSEELGVEHCRCSRTAHWRW
jgi:dTDP-4-amino-4,6-dideoxygalactose transaminase